MYRGQVWGVRLQVKGGLGNGDEVRNSWTVPENLFSANFEDSSLTKFGEMDARFSNEERNLGR